MEYLKLNKRKDIFKLGIMDEDGKIVKNEQGEEVCIEFDLGDIDLPLKYNKCANAIKKARSDLQMQFVIIDKKQDYKNKKQILSYNEEAKAKAIVKFYEEMEKAMDLFLGENGTKKFLNGRKAYWEMFDDLNEALKPFLPKLKLTMTDITDRIENKYKLEEKGVLKND